MSDTMNLSDLVAAQTVGHLMLAVALLLLLSIIASKASGRLGVPALILFLILGMLAGSEGPGGIYFDDAKTAQWLGVVALAFILFSGGLQTNWAFVRRSVWRAASLATAGVAITTAVIAAFAVYALGFTPAEGFLLGAVVSSTDAAAVFSILRARGVKVDEDVAATLELESGGNDPMAVYLTLAATQLITMSSTSVAHLLFEFGREMVLGAIAGLVIGRAAVELVNRLRLEHEGLYIVLTIAVVLGGFSITTLLKGNGFLAVYIAGIVMGKYNFIHRRRLTRFHDGLAWLMQIVMFLVLGLLVFPSQLLPVAGVSLAVAAVLVFVARPLAVFGSVIGMGLSTPEKLLISWVGLRGAVPIVLATFPMLAGVPKSGVIFNIVFFVVLTSVALQGTTIPLVAKWLKMDETSVRDVSPADETLLARKESAMVTLSVSEASAAAGRRVVELRSWPRDSLILVLYRGDQFFVPDGGTEICPGDRLIVLTNKATVDTLRAITEGAPA